jgi:tRNA pseudouridine synthase D (TruD)
LLKSDWHKAISLILQVRPGEHPDVAAAREAWLVEGDLEKALDLMPRRVVAERCILESYKKQGGETRNAMGALSTVAFFFCDLTFVWLMLFTDPSKSSNDVHTRIPVLRMECNSF